MLDLSNNHIGPALLPFFQNMPSLRVLYLQGNPITKLPTYRRHLVSALTGLTYLDDQPVHDIERAACQAWAEVASEVSTIVGGNVPLPSEARCLGHPSLSTRAFAVQHWART